MVPTEKNMDEAKQFWENVLGNESYPATDITMRVHPYTLSEGQGMVRRTVDQQTADLLKQRCKHNDSLIFTYLLTIWNTMFGQYTRSRRIAVGIPNMKSNYRIPQVSLTLPYFQDLKPEASLKEMLIETKSKLDTLYAHASILPFVEENNQPMDTLYNVIIGYKPLHGSHIMDSLSRQYPIVLWMSSALDELEISAAYQADFSEEQVRVMLGHYEQLLSNSLKGSSDVKISELSMLSQEEHTQIAYVFNERKIVEEPELPLHKLFEEYALRFSQRRAVQDSYEALTYEQLSERSDHIAYALLAQGLRPGEVVACICERSVNTISSLLGILKAGGVFLPIDPSSPAGRMEYMYRDSEARMALVSATMVSKMEKFESEILVIEDVIQFAYEKNQEFPSIPIQQGACIVYTSGSTGEPKGILFEHQMLLHHTSAFGKYVVSYEEPKHIGLIAPYFFDVFLEDVFYGLFNGHTLIVISDEAQRDGRLLMEYLGDNEVHTLNATPTQIRILMSSPPHLFQRSHLELLLIGGEPLKESLVHEIRAVFGQTAPTIINCYGPTECCIDVTAYNVVETSDLQGGAIPIGRPIKNVGAYILGSNNEILPVGVIGELCFSGDILAKGYIGKPTESDRVFMPSPFVSGETLYKTGDLAMWLADGNIVFMNRMDSQVKVRGHRVELNEIEWVIQQHSQVKEAVVLHQNEELFAFLVMKDDSALMELEKGIKEKLPLYMQPKNFTLLESFPTNANGKLDKKALYPLVKSEVSDSGRSELITNTEKVLGTIWKNVLDIETVGREDHFFERGGHSLSAAVLSGQIYKQFQTNVSIKQLFATPELYHLAKFIDDSEKEQNTPISPAPVAAFYPLSLVQERLFTLHSAHPDSTAYNMPGIIEIKGALDRQRLDMALERIIQKNEILRTKFEVHDYEPVQRILDITKFSLDWHQLNYDKLQSFIDSFVKPFDLANAPLFRVSVVELDKDWFYVLFDMHHIIADGRTFEILVQEIFDFYNGTDVPEKTIQYKDFAYWEKEHTNSSEYFHLKDFWMKYMGGALPQLSLPYDYDRSEHQTFTGSVCFKEIKGETVHMLKQLSKKNETTMFMNILAAYYVLLNKYSGDQEFIVGTTSSIRDDSNLDMVMGPMINAIAIRQNVDPEIAFSKLLDQVKENVVNVYEHKSYPFHQLVENISFDRMNNQNPIFNTMVIMHQFKEDFDTVVEEMTIKPVAFENKTSKMDLSLELTEHQDSMTICFEYNTQLFAQSTIERLANHFIELLDRIAQKPDECIKTYSLLSTDEQNWQIYELNRNEVSLSFERPIHHLIREQARINPERIAIREGNEKWNYRELMQQADALTNQLVMRGASAGKIVGIMMERSSSLIASILAVLQTGAAYLPIDPMYPEERISYILEDSQCFALISDKPVEKLVGECKFNLVVNSKLEPFVETQCDDTPEISILEPAYIIYTSGSTGQPKGVTISHRSLLNYSLWAAKVYVGGEQDIAFPLYSSIAFDLTITSLFTPLITGNSIVVYNDPPEESLKRIIQDNLVDIIKLTPSHLRLMKEMELEGNRIKRFIVGGEALETKLARDIESIYGKGTIKIYNEYGPTETTVGCMIYELEPDYDSPFVSIGVPADNTRVYVLDEYLKPCPLSVIGELYISGMGVGMGYIGQEELTRERFISNPFENGEWMYRTGDLARLMPDGKLAYVGRIDTQVKVRGYRIELGEVEHYLNQNPNIKESVVFVENDSIGGYALIACVVPAKSNSPDGVKNVEEELQLYLPRYMIPDQIYIMDEIPYTLNGKVDRNALAKKQISTNLKTKESTDISDPERMDTLTTALSEMWTPLLNVSEISINDNFFDLGGHSLKAIMLLSRIKKKFEVEISLESFFANPTIEMLSELVVSRQKPVIPAIKPVENQGHYPLTSAQVRLYFLQQFNNGTVYNIVESFVIEGNLEKEKFEFALRKMIERHEILRTSFHFTEQDGLVQIVHDPDRVQPLLEWCNSALDISEYVQPFDLSAAPLFRTRVVRLGMERHEIKFDFHHIIFDGISMEYFIRDFVSFYNAKHELPPLSIQYRDYSVWQEAFLQTETYAQQEKYWLEQLSGELPVLAFPTDFPRPMVKSFKGSAFRFEVDSSVSSQFSQLCKRNGITLYMGLISLFGSTLYRYTQQEDILIGTPLAGRKQEELEGLIGMFVNTTVLRLALSGGMTFTQLIEAVKKNTVQMLEYQDVPFEQLVERLHVARDTSRNPIFDVMFALQNYDDGGLAIQDSITIVPISPEMGSSKFDLTLFAWEENEQISFCFEYSTDLFEEQTIKRLSTHFINLMLDVIGQPNAPIAHLNMLADHEKRHLNVDILSSGKETQPITLYHWFEQQCEQTPEALALIHDDIQLTYSELHRRTQTVAGALALKGAEAGTIVGVMMERSPEMIISILAVLQTGAAYLPLDPEYPDQRLQYMLDDSMTDVLMTDNQTSTKMLADFQGQRFNVQDIEYDYVSETISGDYPDTEALAYVIYTSGSTGNPKGVKVSHAAIFNTLKWRINHYSFGLGDNTLQVPSLSFDSSVEDIFCALLSGATLTLMSSKDRLDVTALTKIAERHKITHFLMVPSMYAAILETKPDFNYLKSVTVAGESVHAHLVNNHFALFPDVRLFNEYGPTECSVCTTVHEFKAEDTQIRIGKPIDNMEVYILDNHERIVPIGVPGELYITGKGLSKGYLNDDVKTSQRFVHVTELPNQLLYRSGDRGRWLSDGTLEYWGRTDNQVKIRGYRVELEEIERSAMQMDCVTQAAAVMKKTDDSQRLVLYVIMDASEPIEDSQLKKELAQKLPPFMTPEDVIFLNEFPRTANGKIDKLELSLREDLTGLIDRPMENESLNQTEAVLFDAWNIVLKHHHISRHDNFFEVGGNSLLLIQLHARLNEAFSGLLTITDYFTYPSIREMAQYLDDTVTGKEGSRTNEASRVTLGSDLAAMGLSDGAMYRVILAEEKVSIFNEMAKGMAVDIQDITFAIWVYTLNQYAQLENISIDLGVSEDSIVHCDVHLPEFESLEELVSYLYEKRYDPKSNKHDFEMHYPDGEASILYTWKSSSSLYQKYDITLLAQENEEGLTIQFIGSSRIREQTIQEITELYVAMISAVCDQVSNNTTV